MLATTVVIRGQGPTEDRADYEIYRIDQPKWIFIRGIRTITKLRLLTKIDFNLMHLVSLCKFFWQKLQIRGSRDLQFLAISDIFFQILRILCSKNAFN